MVHFHSIKKIWFLDSFVIYIYLATKQDQQEGCGQTFGVIRFVEISGELIEEEKIFIEVHVMNIVLFL